VEVRSWKPEIGPDEDLLVIQNERYLRRDGDTDPEGCAVALVKVATVRPYLKSDIRCACATRWDPGYYAWELKDVRPVSCAEPLLAARGIYDLEVDGLTLSKAL
jgi:hypothetical protein